MVSPRQHTSRESAERAANGLVLIAGADLESRTFYRSAFQRSGYDVLESEDGRDALALALNRHPSLIVIESGLPFIGGWDLCELLRRDTDTRDVPIIVIATDGTRSPANRPPPSASADAVMTKPFSPETLLSEAFRHRTRPARVAGTGSYVTRQPPMIPPDISCPSCDRQLHYDRSHVGGVNEKLTEQWDYLVCASCGTFQYRHRTRRLRRV